MTIFSFSKKIILSIVIACFSLSPLLTMADGGITITTQTAGDRATLTFTSTNTSPTSIIVDYGIMQNALNDHSPSVTVPANNTTPLEISGLSPQTTYYYRARNNVSGSIYGNGTFLTLSSGTTYNTGTNASSAPQCTEGPDGYCLLAPLGGVSVIKNTQLPDYLNMIYKILIGLAGVLAVIMIFYGGVQYMTTDAMGKKQQGRETIKNAILGLLLALGSYVILNTINPKLLNFTFGIDTLNIGYDAPAVITFQSGGGSQGVSSITSNFTTYDTLLAQASQANGVECTLAKAVMMAESAGNPNAQSGAGAKGLMQLMPATAQGLGTDPSTLFDPQVNINTGVRLLKQLKNTACNGTVQNSVCSISNKDFIIAAYNAGPGSNKKARSCSSPDQTLWQCIANGGYQETRNYVPKVDANYNTLVQNNWGC